MRSDAFRGYEVSQCIFVDSYLFNQPNRYHPTSYSSVFNTVQWKRNDIQTIIILMCCTYTEDVHGGCSGHGVRSFGKAWIYKNWIYDDVIKWKHFPRYWPFERGIHRSPVNSLHKGQCRGALMFSLICAWINVWENNREAGDLRPHRAHYDISVFITTTKPNTKDHVHIL